MNEKRVIKKYPNRRLYDTEISKYITLADIRRLVLDQVDFTVRDAKTDEDITRSILLQVIMEEEEDGEPIFTTDMLTKIIRFYGDAVQGLATDFLQQSLTMFVEQQKLYQEQLRDAVTRNPFAAITELTERNIALWRRMQESFFSAATAVSAGQSQSHPVKKGTDSSSDTDKT
ncbi:MAG: polyhydroxyalkanoate synthesis repressor PhaR [Gammaproteobacteria bacterium]|nr:polyhydroxyalkanoate synthesis repressor PhaR [Gammaproteobacteria bacterium]MCI0590340.1 polyhydroxyalkanoate synthesis repressor PhaR [Gammaproteobacteria bacterium]